MNTTRIEAYSDAVFAIIVTIMVLEFHTPESAGIADLLHMLPGFLAYILSFIFITIYWNNHHHLFHVAKRVNPGIMWSNAHLLLWLSFIPFATGWMGKFPDATWPSVLYGVVLLCAAVAYYILQVLIVRAHEARSKIESAIGSDKKGIISQICCLLGIGSAFFSPLLAFMLYVIVALIWIVPDSRLISIIETE